MSYILSLYIYNRGHNILRIFDVSPYSNFQVKRSAIIRNKYGICELPEELPNDLRLRILGN